MKSKKSYLYYSAKLKAKSRAKVLDELRLLSHLWIDESDLFFRLSAAAAECAAGVRTSIEAQVFPLGSSSEAIGVIRLELSDFDVVDTENGG